MNSAGVLVSSLLERRSWIKHGFGTRSGPLSQDGMASLRQIHSALPVVANQPGCAGEGDALIANRPGVAVSIRTADCFPILLADDGRRVVAAIHAGWRGTAAQIVPLTLQKMHDEFGTDSINVHAAIGPGIGACCYEVGEEVARHFGVDRCRHIDLAAANRRQLMDSGVPEAQIQVLGLCTRCDSSRFHSYRRDGVRAGRMISFIRIL